MPYIWSLKNGELPPGLNLASATGRISGTPDRGGKYNFTVRVTDKENKSAEIQLTLGVSDAVSTGVQIINYSSYNPSEETTFKDLTVSQGGSIS